MCVCVFQQSPFKICTETQSQFNPTAPLGDNFKPDNDMQAGLVAQFLEFALKKSPPKGPNLIETMRKSLTASQLGHPDIVKKLPICRDIDLFWSD